MAGGVMNRLRSLPYSPGTIAVGGAVVVGGIWYYMMYMKKKPEDATRDATKAASGIVRPEDTRK